MSDIVISSVPWTATDAPLMAPALLKGVLTKHGFCANGIDLNAEIQAKIKNSPNESSIIKFFTTEQVDAQALPDIHNLFEYMADRLLSYNTNWIALSLLTYLSQVSTKWLCFLLKKKNPNVKIVIGGPGCFNTLLSLDSYVLELRSQKLIDHYIIGDGENSLVELLKENFKYPGINSVTWDEVADLDNVALPDYDEYDFSLYRLRKVSIWGSRGCVRDCTFCDIHQHWSKFQWRSAESIFNEMKHQAEKYNINMYHFADSLVNGNQKEYRKLIRLLAAHNRDLPDHKKIRWSGFFIFRHKEQMKEEDWKYTAESGADILVVGVESFVEHIRYHIKKPFSNQDLDYGLKMAKQYGIGVGLLIIVGYVTETQKDHEEQIQWLYNNKHYANDPVKFIQAGSTLSILPGTWLHQNQAELGLELSGNIYQDWSREEIGSTPMLRLQWAKNIEQAVRDNGFVYQISKDNHTLIESYIETKYAKSN